MERRTSEGNPSTNVNVSSDEILKELAINLGLMSVDNIQKKNREETGDSGSPNKAYFEKVALRGWSLESAWLALNHIFRKADFQVPGDLRAPTGNKNTWKVKLREFRNKATTDAVDLSSAPNAWLTRATYFNSFFTLLECWLRASQAIDMAYAACPLRDLPAPDFPDGMVKDAARAGVSLKRNAFGHFILQDEEGRPYRSC
jgi:hypothetical protein